MSKPMKTVDTVDATFGQKDEKQQAAGMLTESENGLGWKGP